MAAKTSMAMELFEMIRPKEYVTYLSKINHGDRTGIAAFNQTPISQEYTVDTSLLYPSGRRVNTYHVYDMFGKVAGMDAKEVKQCMLDEIESRFSWYQAKSNVVLSIMETTLEDWIRQHRHRRLRADEICLFALSVLFGRHTVVFTATKPWCTLDPYGHENCSSFLSLCDFHLLNLGDNMFIKLEPKEEDRVFSTLPPGATMSFFQTDDQYEINYEIPVPQLSEFKTPDTSDQECAIVDYIPHGIRDEKHQRSRHCSLSNAEVDTVLDSPDHPSAHAKGYTNTNDNTDNIPVNLTANTTPNIDHDDPGESTFCDISSNNNEHTEHNLDKTSIVADHIDASLNEETPIATCNNRQDVKSDNNDQPSPNVTCNNKSQEVSVNCNNITPKSSSAPTLEFTDNSTDCDSDSNSIGSHSCTTDSSDEEHIPQLIRVTKEIRDLFSSTDCWVLLPKLTNRTVEFWRNRDDKPVLSMPMACDNDIKPSENMDNDTENGGNSVNPLPPTKDDTLDKPTNISEPVTVNGSIENGNITAHNTPPEPNTSANTVGLSTSIVDGITNDSVPDQGILNTGATNPVCDSIQEPEPGPACSGTTEENNASIPKVGDSQLYSDISSPESETESNLDPTVNKQSSTNINKNEEVSSNGTDIGKSSNSASDSLINPVRGRSNHYSKRKNRVDVNYHNMCMNESDSDDEGFEPKSKLPFKPLPGPNPSTDRLKAQRQIVNNRIGASSVKSEKPSTEPDPAYDGDTEEF